MISHDLARIERYLDALPRTAAEPEEVGPFTLFRPTTISMYYARPRLGNTDPITPADIALLAARCTELGLPLAIEGSLELAPSLVDAAMQAGLDVVIHPFLALARDDPRPEPPPLPAGVSCRRLASGDPDATVARAVADVSFSVGGTTVGAEGIAERDAAVLQVPAERVALTAARTASGHTVVIGGYVEGHGLVSVSHHQPVDGCSEIVGVATLPAFRRRGLGAAVTAAAIADAFAGDVDLLVLSAADDDVARGYERLGFVRVGHSVAAEPAAPAVDASTGAPSDGPVVS